MFINYLVQLLYSHLYYSFIFIHFILINNQTIYILLCQVAHEHTLDRQNILREQKKDAFCNKQTPGSYRSRKEFFLDGHDILYRRRSNGNHQLAVAATLVSEVIRENHAPVCLAHRGTKQTHDWIALHYWWPGMRKAIKSYISFCDPCQRRKAKANKRSPQRNKDLHVNRLKEAHGQKMWNDQHKQKPRRKVPNRSADHSDSNEEDEIKIGPFPLITSNVQTSGREGTTLRTQDLYTPDAATQILDTPFSEQTDPSYHPPETPRSRRELQTTRTDPPVTRSRTRVLNQDSTLQNPL